MLNKETNSGEMRSSSDVPTAQLVDASLLTETMGIFVWKVSFAPQKWKLSKAGQHVVRFVVRDNDFPELFINCV